MDKEARAGRMAAQRELNAITCSRLLRKHAHYKIRDFMQFGFGERKGRRSCAVWKWRPRLTANLHKILILYNVVYIKKWYPLLKHFCFQSQI